MPFDEWFLLQNTANTLDGRDKTVMRRAWEAAYAVGFADGYDQGTYEATHSDQEEFDK